MEKIGRVGGAVFSVSENIKAIQTNYKGYRFRSRLEARWAVFLDSIGESWEYEKEGYLLPTGAYLPDFWLPRMNCWLEIKGVNPTENERQLCAELMETTGFAAVMAWGMPAIPLLYDYPEDQKQKWSWLKPFWKNDLVVYCGDLTDSSGGSGPWDEVFWATNQSGKLYICSNNSRNDRSFYGGSSFLNDFPGMVLLDDTISPITEHHISRAKAARFEFGEHG